LKKQEIAIRDYINVRDFSNRNVTPENNVLDRCTTLFCVSSITLLPKEKLEAGVSYYIRYSLYMLDRCCSGVPPAGAT
jgi:hypothetical protein